MKSKNLGGSVGISSATLDDLHKLAANMQWKGKEPRTVELGDKLKQLIKAYESACTRVSEYEMMIEQYESDSADNEGENDE